MKRARSFFLFTALQISLTLAGAARAQAAELGSPSAIHIGESMTLISSTLAETRRINVYAPPAYLENPALRLPVLYMPDGGVAEDFVHIAGLLQVSIANGSMRPFLLVGIKNTERRRDLTGPTEVEREQRAAPRIGDSAKFRDFLRTELIPQIKAKYRTAAESAIIGESLAGLFVVETWVLAPDRFDSYIALDPSLWWNKAQLKWKFVQMPEETHSSIYHPGALQGLRWLFKPK